jgi:hypothetical protein
MYNLSDGMVEFIASPCSTENGRPEDKIELAGIGLTLTSRCRSQLLEISDGTKIWPPLGRP